MRTFKDKNGTVTTNTYDNRDRLIKTQKGTQYIEYTYDSAGNLLTSKDSTGTINYEYNIDGTLKKKTYPDGKSITYNSYDDNKQLLQMTDYFGNVTQYTYNGRGQTKTIGIKYTGTTSYKTTSYVYYADGALKKTTIPNQNMKTQYTYNYAGQISLLQNTSNYASTSHNYTYDNSGNIVGKVESVNGTAATTSYIYDKVGRLVREDITGKGWNTYNYDEYNNLISEVGWGDTFHTYDANNRLIKTKDLWTSGETADGEKMDDWEITYTYDNNGKMLSSLKKSMPNCEGYVSNQKTYTYDSFDRLTGFSDSLGFNASYSYYSDRLRRSKTVGSNTLKYYYNGDDLINESRNGSDCTSYLMGVDGYICRKQSNHYSYYFKNGHGDVVYAMYQNGGKVSQYAYTAWGEKHTSYDFYGGIDQTPIRYAGQYYDYESGMTYLRARYYDSEIKRFISEDPAKDGLNWYGYCGNNPVMFVDVNGLEFGTIRDFSNDVSMMLLGKPDYTFGRSERGRGDYVNISVGHNYMWVYGTFYFDGQAWNKESSEYEYLAYNINGTLYAERTDYYDVMGIGYISAVAEKKVTSTGNMLRSIAVATITGSLGIYLNAGAGLAIGVFGTTLDSLAQDMPGEYKINLTLAYIPIDGTDLLETIITYEVYYKAPGYDDYAPEPIEVATIDNGQISIDQLKYYQ